MNCKKEWWPVKYSGPTRLLTPRFPGHPPDSLDPVSLRPYQFCFSRNNVISILIHFLKKNLYSHHLFDHPLPSPPVFSSLGAKSLCPLVLFTLWPSPVWPTCKSGPTTMLHLSFFFVFCLLIEELK